MKNKLIVPIFSMRSHDTGEYSILKDGNFQLHLSRMDRCNDIIAIPKNTSDYQEFLKLGLVPECNIIKLNYLENAYNTRKEFWKILDNTLTVENICYDNNLTLLTDITGYTGLIDVMYNFNITAYPDINRPFIDEFLEIDVKSINNSIGCTVLNTKQREVLINSGVSSHLISVNTQVINPEILDILSNGPAIQIKNKIFFPFRISDLAYKFSEVVEKYKDYEIIITDPNNSYNANYTNVSKININKNEYYRILKSSPTIVYNENPKEIFHPGLAELIYFNCDIISPYEMPKLEDLLVTS